MKNPTPKQTLDEFVIEQVRVGRAGLTEHDLLQLAQKANYHLVSHNPTQRITEILSKHLHRPGDDRSKPLVKGCYPSTDGETQFRWYHRDSINANRLKADHPGMTFLSLIDGKSQADLATLRNLAHQAAYVNSGRITFPFFRDWLISNQDETGVVYDDMEQASIDARSGLEMLLDEPPLAYFTSDNVWVLIEDVAPARISPEVTAWLHELEELHTNPKMYTLAIILARETPQMMTAQTAAVYLAEYGYVDEEHALSSQGGTAISGTLGKLSSRGLAKRDPETSGWSASVDIPNHLLPQIPVYEPSSKPTVASAPDGSSPEMTPAMAAIFAIIQAGPKKGISSADIAYKLARAGYYNDDKKKKSKALDHRGAAFIGKGGSLLRDLGLVERNEETGLWYEVNRQSKPSPNPSRPASSPTTKPTVLTAEAWLEKYNTELKTARPRYLAWLIASNPKGYVMDNAPEDMTKLGLFTDQDLQTKGMSLVSGLFGTLSERNLIRKIEPGSRVWVLTASNVNPDSIDLPRLASHDEQPLNLQAPPDLDDPSPLEAVEAELLTPPSTSDDTIEIRAIVPQVMKITICHSLGCSEENFTQPVRIYYCLGCPPQASTRSQRYFTDGEEIILTLTNSKEFSVQNPFGSVYIEIGV